MKDIFHGIQSFQQNVFPQYQELFVSLRESQSPTALMITCADSRIDPCLMTQSPPGRIFVLRNAGNIVPTFVPHSVLSEAATLEFAISGLGVKHVIICGHSQCAAVKGMLFPEQLTQFPLMAGWVKENRDRLLPSIQDTQSTDLDPENFVEWGIQQNILLQLQQLKTHPVVLEKLEKQQLQLHGWYYRFESGEIFAYHQDSESFLPVDRIAHEWTENTQSSDTLPVL